MHSIKKLGAYNHCTVPWAPYPKHGQVQILSAELCNAATSVNDPIITPSRDVLQRCTYSNSLCHVRVAVVASLLISYFNRTMSLMAVTVFLCVSSKSSIFSRLNKTKTWLLFDHFIFLQHFTFTYD